MPHPTSQGTSNQHRSRSRSALLAACCSAAIALSLIGCDRIESILLERAADRAFQGDRTDWLDDGGLHLVLCGTGSPLPDADRAGPCAAVIAAGRFYLIDVGPGSWENVQLWRLPRARLSGVLLTHFHSDHIGELGEVVMQSWVAGRAQPLPVYGPPGVTGVVGGFQQAYALDTQYRIAHHGEEAMPPEGALSVAVTVDVPAPGKGKVVFDEDGLRLTAFRVDHAPVDPAYGYRFDYRGRSVVISGDTKKSESLIENARGADVLVHEALAAHLIRPISEIARRRGEKRWAKLTSDILEYHTTPVEAAEVAAAAQVRLLVLTHLVPPPSNALVKRLFLRGVADAWAGEVVLGADGMHFTLPGESEAIESESLE